MPHFCRHLVFAECKHEAQYAGGYRPGTGTGNRACIVHLGAAAAGLRSAIEAAQNGNEQGENDDNVVCRSQPPRSKGEREREEGIVLWRIESCGKRAATVVPTKWPAPVQWVAWLLVRLRCFSVAVASRVLCHRMCPSVFHSHSHGLGRLGHCPSARRLNCLVECIMWRTGIEAPRPAAPFLGLTDPCVLWRCVRK